MIIEIKDMPTQKIKSIDIHIAFDDNDVTYSNVLYNDSKCDSKCDRNVDGHAIADDIERDKNIEIPQEMLDGEF